MESDLEKRESEYEIILRVMANIFVEIRATRNIKKANILADVFHNAPSGIASAFPADKIEQKYTSRLLNLDAEII